MTTTESFFSLLKSHRESKGVEIEEIAEYTKINPKYLHAIESGDFSVLPNVYMRLFLRSYAQYIGADTAQALDDFELHTTGKVSAKFENSPGTLGDSPKEPPTGMPPILGNSPIPPKQIMTGIAVIVGLFLFFKIVSGLSQQDTEIKDKVEVKVEDKAQIEEAQTVDAISVKPEEVKVELTQPAEPTEAPPEDVKKKP
ncbi:MAG: helix-turn-helix domain-containing protein [Candidatus Marinimicrobia bacterium]|nr:helix-turn-helix domain-containing protein [Candidatus Neomarinimicrobiota bacterium]